jgi:hypothetical protein
MSNIDQLLQDAFDDLAAEAPHDPDLGQKVRRRSRYRRVVSLAPLAAAVAVVAVVSTVLLLRPAAVGSGARPVSACSPVQTAVLPTWARAGFTDPEPSMPFVTSKSGVMLAIIFNDPLVSPPVPDSGNKILWVTDVSASPGDPLIISGKLEGGTATMTTRVEGGPGPSGIDVPAPGCWLFDLTWGNHHDTIAIAYVKS